MLANVGDDDALIDPIIFSGFEATATDIVTGDEVDLHHGIALPPHGFVWLRVTPV